MGEMLKAQVMQTGGDARKKATRSHGETEQLPPTLAEVGITKSMSSRAQKIACFIGVLVGGVGFPVSRHSNYLN